MQRLCSMQAGLNQKLQASADALDLAAQLSSGSSGRRQQRWLAGTASPIEKPPIPP